ncbi:MAG TPA: class A beta-lactamase [Phenylobacterium sp.]|jgi:beta-lactamase class A
MVWTNGITRRGVAALFMSLCAGPRSHAAPAAAELDRLERRVGGELGVCAVEVGTSRVLAWRPDDRFMMCSTFKLLAAAATLVRVDAGRDDPGGPVAYSAADLVEPHPVTGAHVQAGEMPLHTLCQAAVQESDSTAANLLMRRLGGPGALTGFMRSLGDRVTRMDRYELDAIRPNGDLDTTSPRAMALSVRRLLFTGALKPGSAQLLEDWMRGDWRGAHRIRAGVPGTWVAGSKPGTSPTATNDVAILRPRGAAPVIVAAYYRSAPAELQRREHVLKEVGEVVARWVAA